MATNSLATKAANNTPIPFDENIISSIVINGDLSKLSPTDKVHYYRQFCERLGLDALTQPFKLLSLNGKQILYCGREGAQQLNKIHKVSHEIKSRETVNGCFMVTAKASTPDGRHTESIGVVPIENLRGDALCNAMMKGETKAKRRATLDLLGLGILDETETQSIPNAQYVDLSTAELVGAPGVGKVPNGGASAAHEAQRANTKVSQFKKKYSTVEEVEAVLANATDVKDVANLYYINAEMVEGLPELKAKFTEKKNEYFTNSPLPVQNPTDDNGGMGAYAAS